MKNPRNINIGRKVAHPRAIMCTSFEVKSLKIRVRTIPVLGIGQYLPVLGSLVLGNT